MLSTVVDSYSISISYSYSSYVQCCPQQGPRAQMGPLSILLGLFKYKIFLSDSGPLTLSSIHSLILVNNDSFDEFNFCSF